MTIGEWKKYVVKGIKMAVKEEGGHQTQTQSKLKYCKPNEEKMAELGTLLF